MNGVVKGGCGNQTPTRCCSVVLSFIKFTQLFKAAGRLRTMLQGVPQQLRLQGKHLWPLWLPPNAIAGLASAVGSDITWLPLNSGGRIGSGCGGSDSNDSNSGSAVA